jgi:hypothetical protein
MVPAASIELVLVEALNAVEPVVVVLLLTPVEGIVVVVVVSFVAWAKALLKATALTAPTANNFINGVCFMFVLCFG